MANVGFSLKKLVLFGFSLSTNLVFAENSNVDVSFSQVIDHPQIVLADDKVPMPDDSTFEATSFSEEIEKPFIPASAQELTPVLDASPSSEPLVEKVDKNKPKGSFDKFLRRICATTGRRKAAAESAGHLAQFGTSVVLGLVRRATVPQALTPGMKFTKSEIDNMKWQRIALGYRFIDPNYETALPERFMNSFYENAVPLSVKTIVKYLVSQKLDQKAESFGFDLKAKSLSLKEKNLCKAIPMTINALNAFQRINKFSREVTAEKPSLAGTERGHGVLSERLLQDLGDGTNDKKSGKKNGIFFGMNNPSLKRIIPGVDHSAVGWAGNVSLYALFSYLQKLEADDVSFLTPDQVKAINELAELFDAGAVHALQYDGAEFPKAVSKWLGNTVVKKMIRSGLERAGVAKDMKEEKRELFLSLFNELFVMNVIAATMGSAPVARVTSILANDEA